jgi:hypothetical protein
MTREAALTEGWMDLGVVQRARPHEDEGWRLMELGATYCVSDCDPDPWCACSRWLTFAAEIHLGLADDENRPESFLRLMPNL